MFSSHLQGHTPVSSILPPGPPQSTKSSIQGPLWSLQIQANSPETWVTILYLFPLLSCSLLLSPLPLSSFLSSPFLTLSSLLLSIPSSLLSFYLPPSIPLPSSLLSSYLLSIFLSPPPILFPSSSSLASVPFIIPQSSFSHLLFPLPPSPQFLPSHLLPFTPYPLFAWSSHQVCKHTGQDRIERLDCWRGRYLQLLFGMFVFFPFI